MEEERDFLMRQIHQFVKGIGRFLTRDSLKEFINEDLSAEATLTDQEIDQILLLNTLKEIIEDNRIDEDTLKQKLNITLLEVDRYYQLHDHLTDDQHEKIQAFIMHYQPQI